MAGLPEKLDGAFLDHFQELKGLVEEAAKIKDLRQHAFGEFFRFLQKHYGLGPSDGIRNDGTIVRVKDTPPEEEPT